MGLIMIGSRSMVRGGVIGSRGGVIRSRGGVIGGLCAIDRLWVVWSWGVVGREGVHGVGMGVRAVVSGRGGHEQSCDGNK